MKQQKQNNCPDSFLLERVALHPDLMDDALKAHLESCSFCRDSLTSYQEYYQLAGGIEDKTLQRLTDEIFARQKRIIRLEPVKAQSDGESFRLAAQSRWQSRQTFIRGFVNSDEDMVGRLMRDENTNEIILYLIAHQDKLKENYLISFEGHDATWLSDGSGTVNLGIIRQINFTDAGIQLTSPRSTIELAPLIKLDKKVIADGTFLVEASESDQLQMIIEDTSGKRIYKICVDNIDSIQGDRNVHVAVYQGDSRCVRPAVNGIAVFEDLDETRTLNIKIY